VAAGRGVHERWVWRVRGLCHLSLPLCGCGDVKELLGQGLVRVGNRVDARRRGCWDYCSGYSALGFIEQAVNNRSSQMWYGVSVSGLIPFIRLFRIPLLDCSLSCLVHLLRCTLNMLSSPLQSDIGCDER